MTPRTVRMLRDGLPATVFCRSVFFRTLLGSGSLEVQLHRFTSGSSNFRCSAAHSLVAVETLGLVFDGQRGDLGPLVGSRVAFGDAHLVTAYCDGCEVQHPNGQLASRLEAFASGLGAQATILLRKC